MSLVQFAVIKWLKLRKLQVPIHEMNVSSNTEDVFLPRDCQ